RPWRASRAWWRVPEPAVAPGHTQSPARRRIAPARVPSGQQPSATPRWPGPSVAPDAMGVATLEADAGEGLHAGEFEPEPPAQLRALRLGPQFGEVVAQRKAQPLPGVVLRRQAEGVDLAVDAVPADLQCRGVGTKTQAVGGDPAPGQAQHRGAQAVRRHGDALGQRLVLAAAAQDAAQAEPGAVVQHAEPYPEGGALAVVGPPGVAHVHRADFEAPVDFGGQ